jgi:hypothetical protein
VLQLPFRWQPLQLPWRMSIAITIAATGQPGIASSTTAAMVIMTGNVINGIGMSATGAQTGVMTTIWAGTTVLSGRNVAAGGDGVLAAIRSLSDSWAP